ncbi:MAG: hypothetical protein D6780_06615 [Candidatus Dadabacteria bacterium]|nr:MAG: hypothetical protein D6780_06615 [Candidatus Dadabacteria bacterium]
MEDIWKKREKAKEEEYFRKLNEKALERIRARSKARLSPITGKPMETKNIMGVVVDYCPDSGGIWLDKGELEEIIKRIEQAKEKGEVSLAEDFLNLLFETENK